MVARALLTAVLSLVIGLYSPVSSQAQTSTLTVLDNEVGGPGPGDVITFIKRAVRYAIHMAFDSGEAVTHRVESDGSLTAVGRSALGPEPRAIAMARNGDYAVVVNSIVNQVVVMSVGDDGLLTEVNRVPSGGLNPYDVAVGFNDIVVVANRDSDQINTFHIDRRGRLTPLDVMITGIDPHVVSVSSRGFVGVANQSDRSVSLFELDRRGALRSLGPPVVMSITGSNPAASMTPRTLAWQGRNLFVALDAPAPSEDLIRAFHVTRRGEVEHRGDTPAGAFLTDLEVTPRTLFAVTVNVNGPGGQDDRDEIRAYRKDGTALTMDAAVQTPGLPPSFKQVTTGRRRADGSRPVFVTEYQGGFVRSLEYDPVD